MRKLLLSLVAMFAMAGLVIAAEVTITKFDKEKKEITVKEGKEGEEKEKTYKFSKDAKFTVTDKKGENGKEVKYEDFEKGASKIGDKGLKVEIKTEKDEVTELTWKRGGKKN